MDSHRRHRGVPKLCEYKQKMVLDASCSKPGLISASLLLSQVLIRVACLTDTAELYGAFNLLELERNRYELDITDVPVTKSIVDGSERVGKH